jgi:spermidine synthase
MAVRLSPLVISDYIGEVIPFTQGALLSTIAMAPVGILSGWLFSIIAKQSDDAADSIVVVYLFEGIGAFVGGLIITIFGGGIFSTLSLSVMIGAVVLTANYIGLSTRRTVVLSAVCIFCLLGAAYLIPGLDRAIDAVKYRSYNVIASFDTHYGHETLLNRDNSYTLMTDNTIEAVMPDPETAENRVIPPVIYHPEAKDILFIGRAEFGVAQIAESLKCNLTEIDPRNKLSAALDKAFHMIPHIRRIDDDPVNYLSGKDKEMTYDIIIINPGGPDNYQNCRFYTASFFSDLKKRLSKDGLVFIPTNYDTDRYIAPEKKQVLSMIYRTISGSFNNVSMWPGNMTLFLASQERATELPFGSILDRIERIEFAATYIHDDYLQDRLGFLKMERLLDAVTTESTINSIDKPLLTHYQALFRSMTSPTDRRLMNFILQSPGWIILFPILICLLFIVGSFGKRRSQRYGLFLYFTAGVVSLSLELITFYLYQMRAGSLYSEMAILIGAFMLGLAVGTYYAHKVKSKRPLEYLSMILFLVATAIFMTMYKSVSHDVLILFHMLFLLVVAIATGTLFVAATERYYASRRNTNRGTGYAWELVGSSLGALVTTTILLPIIGVQWLLLSIIGLILLALVGSVISAKV